MKKSRRTPILAAGGIVIRNDSKPLVAIVQRRRDAAWVLPKGKLKPNEEPIAAAKREATEETGCDVRVQEFLGVISYIGGNGPKIAHFWRMQAIDGPVGKLMDDIKAEALVGIHDEIVLDAGNKKIALQLVAQVLDGVSGRQHLDDDLGFGMTGASLRKPTPRSTP
jgi:ADP-ribose pyrophosphatase YjhB (NUDIX family)